MTEEIDIIYYNLMVLHIVKQAGDTITYKDACVQIDELVKKNEINNKTKDKGEVGSLK